MKCESIASWRCGYWMNNVVRHAIHVSDYIVWMEFVTPLSYNAFQADLTGTI